MYSDDVLCDDLNMQITLEEIRDRLLKLKTKKGAGPDEVLNEMLKNAVPHIESFLQELFHFLFTNGKFPLEWSRSIIVPIHKKGDLNCCDNYRPISLTSLISKVYTGILYNRLSVFTENYEIIPEEQAGFREGFSTIDHIFSLHAMITKQFLRNRKLYVAFIDYRKCFDSIHRDALFTVLEKNGIKGYFLEAIKSIYTVVSASVRNNNEMTDFFNCPVGLKQGCLLSPILFNIFMTEFSRKINFDGRHGIQFSPGDPIIHHLLYADDNVLVSDSPVGLQSKLNLLYEQSNRLGLEVNLEKSKIIVFRKGGRLSRHEKWFFNDIPVEIVNSYSYLGVNFTTKMSLVKCSSAMIAKAKKACYSILRSLSKLNCCNLNIFCKLFDAKVLPILSYGSELFGMIENVEIERVHTNAMKRFLNVSTQCSNTLLYYETGRYPVNISLKLKCVKYWLSLLKKPRNRISKQAYVMLERLSLSGKTNWVSAVQNLLCTNGFGIVWIFRGVGDDKQFLSSLRERLRDCFIQGIEERIQSSNSFCIYNNFKSVFGQELYLSQMYFNKFYSRTLLRFRLGVSPINSHRYKYNPDINSKSCPFCKNKIENEFHILFECPPYEALRLRYIPACYLNVRNTFSMNVIMSTQNFALAKYLCSVFTARAKFVD